MTDTPETSARSAVAARLHSVAQSFEGDRVAIGDLVDALGRTGIGLMLLVLAVPSFLPIPGVPLGMVFGSAIALICIQLLLGARSILLPEWLRRRTLARMHVVVALQLVVPVVGRAEAWLRPRHQRLTRPRMRAWFAFPILLLAIAIVLPIPLGNQLPALAIMLFGFGFMLKDGLAVVAAAVLSVVALAWNTAVVVFGVQLVGWLYDGVTGWLS